MAWILCKDKSHEHATVKRKLTAQTFIWRDTNWTKKPDKKSLKQTRIKAGFVISSFVETTSVCMWKISHLNPDNSQLVNGTWWIYLHIEESVYMIWKVYFLFAHFSFTLADGIKHLIVTGVFVSSLWVSSSAWFITGATLLVWTADKKKKEKKKS